MAIKNKIACIKEGGRLLRHPLFNLNLIVDRPNGLIKEGK
jgi:hypothetical protein